MSSLRATNVLLTIIAGCLLAIVARDFVPAPLPAAHAANPVYVEGPVRTQLFACADYSGDQCQQWRPVMSTGGGLR